MPPEWAPESQTNAISHAIDPPISQMSVYWRRRPITNERIRHSCAIQAGTGNVVCWGDNGWGEAAPPDTVNGVSGTATDIAAGGSVFEVGHSCAIQAATGNVVCWGGNDDGQTTPPDAVNGVSGTATDIAAGGFHSCAIQTGTGNVICWGFNSAGQATPPDAVNGVSGTASDIAAGRFHSCAIQAATGNVVCWGANGFGRATPPDAVNGVSGTATAIAAGDLHSLAIVELPSDCICRVDNVNPNQVVLKNVATGGTFSSKTKKMILIVHAEDAPGASCDAGEVSNPTSINLTMEDDDCGGPPENCGSTGDILIDSRKTIVCEPGKTTNVMRDVFVEGPLHCESSAVPSPTFSNGDVTATVSIAGQPDFVEVLNVKCFP